MISLTIIVFLVLCVAVAVIGASAFGLGLNNNDHTSAAYISANTFLTFSASIALVSILFLTFYPNKTCPIQLPNIPQLS